MAIAIIFVLGAVFLLALLITKGLTKVQDMTPRILEELRRHAALHRLEADMEAELDFSGFYSMYDHGEMTAAEVDHAMTSRYPRYWRELKARKQAAFRRGA